MRSKGRISKLTALILCITMTVTSTPFVVYANPDDYTATLVEISTEPIANFFDDPFTITADSGINTLIIEEDGDREPDDPIIGIQGHLEIDDIELHIERERNLPPIYFEVRNNTGRALEFFLVSYNPYLEDLLMDFVESASAEEPFVIMDGETIEVPLTLFAHMSRRPFYEIPIVAYIVEDGVPIEDTTAILTLHVPQINFGLNINQTDFDPTTMTRTFSLQNTGDLIGNLNLSLEGPVADYAFFMPAIEQVEMAVGEILSGIQIIPDLSRFAADGITRVEGWLVAEAGGQLISQPIYFDTYGQDITITTFERLGLLQAENPFWDMEIITDPDTVYFSHWPDRDAYVLDEDNLFDIGMGFDVAFGNGVYGISPIGLSNYNSDENRLRFELDMASEAWDDDPALFEETITLARLDNGNLVLTFETLVSGEEYSVLLQQLPDAHMANLVNPLSTDIPGYKVIKNVLDITGAASEVGYIGFSWILDLTVDEFFEVLHSGLIGTDLGDLLGATELANSLGVSMVQLTDMVNSLKTIKQAASGLKVAVDALQLGMDLPQIIHINPNLPPGYRARHTAVTAIQAVAFAAGAGLMVVTSKAVVLAVTGAVISFISSWARDRRLDIERAYLNGYLDYAICMCVEGTPCAKGASLSTFFRRLFGRLPTSAFENSLMAFYANNSPIQRATVTYRTISGHRHLYGERGTTAWLNGQLIGGAQQTPMIMNSVFALELPVELLQPGQNHLLRQYHINYGQSSLRRGMQIIVEYSPNTEIGFIGNPESLLEVRSLPDLAVYEENIQASDINIVGEPSEPLQIAFYNRGSAGTWVEAHVYINNQRVYTDSAAYGEYRYMEPFSRVSIFVPWTPTQVDNEVRVELTNMAFGNLLPERTPHGQETDYNNAVTINIPARARQVPDIGAVSPATTNDIASTWVSADITNQLDLRNVTFTVNGGTPIDARTSQMGSHVENGVRASTQVVGLTPGSNTITVTAEYNRGFGETGTVTSTHTLYVQTPVQVLPISFSVDTATVRNPIFRLLHSTAVDTTVNVNPGTTAGTFTLTRPTGLEANPRAFNLMVISDDGVIVTNLDDLDGATLTLATGAVREFIVAPGAAVVAAVNVSHVTVDGVQLPVGHSFLNMDRVLFSVNVTHISATVDFAVSGLEARAIPIQQEFDVPLPYTADFSPFSISYDGIDALVDADNAYLTFSAWPSRFTEGLFSQTISPGVMSPPTPIVLGEQITVTPGAIRVELALSRQANVSATIARSLTIAERQIMSITVGSIYDGDLFRLGSTRVTGGTNVNVNIHNMWDSFGNELRVYNATNYSDQLVGVARFTDVTNPSNVVEVPFSGTISDVTAGGSIAIPVPNIRGEFYYSIILSTDRSILPIEVTPTPPIPTATPSPIPTATPSPIPTATPSPIPTATPSPIPTATPSPVPTATPSLIPTAMPSPMPTATPPMPTAIPSPIPTATPPSIPTAIPSPMPTATPPSVPTTPTPTIPPQFPPFRDRRNVGTTPALPPAERTPTPTPTPTLIPEPIEVSVAEALFRLGLFVGTGVDTNGNPIFELERQPTRLEALALVIRLMGLQSEAMAFSGNIRFTDVPDWGEHYAAFGYHIGITVGVNEERTLFAPNRQVTSHEFTTFLLRVLGYSEADGDFIFEEAMQKALSIGFFSPFDITWMYTDDFLRYHAVHAMANALLTNPKDSDVLLLYRLVDQGVFSRADGAWFQENIN